MSTPATPAFDWYPHPTGDTALDFALRTAFENLYTLRNQFNATKATIPPPQASFADISKALTGSSRTALNVTGLPGTLSQPQPAMFPRMKALTPSSSAVDGQIEIFNGIPYIFNGTTQSWQALQSQVLIGKRVERQNHTLFPQFDPTTLPKGSLFWETDTTLFYITHPDNAQAGSPNNWFYATGIWPIYWPYRNAPFTAGNFGAYDWNYTDNNVLLLVIDQNPPANTTGDASLLYSVQWFNGTGTTAIYQAYYQTGLFINRSASRPTGIPTVPSSGLVVTDAGFLEYCTNCGHTWQWQGALHWGWAPEESGAGQVVLAPVAPNPGVGWWQQIPTGGGTFTVADAAGDAGTAFSYPAYSAFNSANPGWFFYARL